MLIPAPYYAAFESDMKVVAQCVPLKVSMVNPSEGPTTDELDAARILATKKHLKVKMLLLTNPNNPLGTIYSPETIKNAIDWARSHNIHTVVDEIYGLSVHKVSWRCHRSKSASSGRCLTTELFDMTHFLNSRRKTVFGLSPISLVMI